jgi:hypothetical protein
MADVSNLVFGQIFNKMLQIKQSDTELTWYGGEKSKSIFSETKLLEIKGLSLEHYEFLIKIDRNFINITKYPFDLKSCFEYNAEYRFDKEYLRKIMQDYVRPDDLEQSLVAGGFFSKYVENPISAKFPRLFSLLSSKSDIDIFILNGSSQIYKAWFLQRKIKVHSEYCANHYCNSYSRFENFKIETGQNQIVNLILIRGQNNNHVSFNSISDFDLDFSKILYSYKFDSIYVHATLFKQSKLINDLYGLDMKVENLRKYHEILIKEKNNLTQTAQRFLNDDQDMTTKEEFCSFLTTNFVYFIKYCLKGYSNSTKETNEFIELIQYFYTKFADVVIYKLESEQIDYDCVVEITTKCLKKYLFG